MSITLTAELRTEAEKGKGASRRLRHADQIPAIVYGGTGEPISIKLSHKDTMKAAEQEAFYSGILELNIGSIKENVVLRDLQRHPYKKQLLHVDFLRIVAGQAITMNVPLHFINADTAPGLKEGGIINHNMTDVEVKCKPKDLPPHIDVDLGHLNIKDVVHLSDLVIPKDVELTIDISDSSHNLPVALMIPKPVIEKEPEVVAEELEEGEAEEGAEETSEETKNSDEA